MPGAFMGKFAFQSTAGASLYLAPPPPGSSNTAATFSSSTQVEWIAYDGGTNSGNQQLIFATPLPNPVYLYVDASLGWTEATANIFGATPFYIDAQTGSQVYWENITPAATIEGSYDLSSGFKGLAFDASLSGVTLQQTTITPSLVTLTAKGSASGCDFSGADLTGASFAGLDCTNANFSGCILDGTIFTGATLTGAQFVGCDLTSVVWGDNPQASGADFTGAIGRGVVFNSTGTTTAQQANFDSATFTGADFSGASFSGASLDGAFVYGADFSGADLAGANLSSLNGGISGGNIGFDLSWAYLADANLMEAHLEGANLSHVQLYFTAGGSLVSAHLINTNFSHADLTGLCLTSATIAGANFTDAILIGCDFTGVTIEASPEGLPVSFCGAHLEGAQFPTASLTGVHLAGAYVADENGIPLFTTPMDPAYAAALNAGKLPSGFNALFAGFGYALGAAPIIAAGGTAGPWTITQTPVETGLGVELTQFQLVATSTTLTVYATGYSLNEMSGSVGVNLGANLPVQPTVLDVSALDATTRCPNGAMLSANQALGMTWEQMLTASRQPVVSNGS